LKDNGIEIDISAIPYSPFLSYFSNTIEHQGKYQFNNLNEYIGFRLNYMCISCKFVICISSDASIIEKIMMKFEISGKRYELIRLEIM
jgi:hypothetical protein